MRKHIYRALGEVFVAGASGFLDELGRRLAERILPSKEEEDDEEEEKEEK